MDRYFVAVGRFGEVVYLKGMNMVILMHLQGIAIQYPLYIFRIVRMMMHIDIAITHLERIFLLGVNGARNLFGFLCFSQNDRAKEESF